MFIISSNSGDLSKLQEQSLKYAARMNNTPQTDINVLYGKLEAIAEDGNNLEWLKMEGEDQIVVTKWDNISVVTIKQVN